MCKLEISGRKGELAIRKSVESSIIAQLLESDRIYCDRVECTNVHHLPLSFSKLYIHEVIEISFVERGSGIHQIANQSIPCTQGDVYVIHDNIPHGYFLASKHHELLVRRIRFDIGNWFDSDVAAPDSNRFCYVHYRLTGKRVLGVGDASGMFPISDGNYDRVMLEKFDTVAAKKGHFAPLEDLLPRVLSAGEDAGTLSEAGAKWLDPTGNLKAGCMLCPPEGDAGTGMVATNSVMPKTANVSAGTSAFLMAVLEKDLDSYYKEIDMVTTPAGDPVAMVHVNNFASEITAWTNLFEEVIAIGGGEIERGRLFDALYGKSLEGDARCGGLVGYNFLAGEPTAVTLEEVAKMALLTERLNPSTSEIDQHLDKHYFRKHGKNAYYGQK